MLKSCSHCGSIHDSKYQCPKKPKRYKRPTPIDKFRNTSSWRKKSVEIRKRDKGLCQICIRKLYNTQHQYTFDTIEVHHIIPLSEDMKRGLDNANLISLCKYHHYMADDGDIPRQVQHEIAKEQGRLNNL